MKEKLIIPSREKMCLEPFLLFVVSVSLLHFNLISKDSRLLLLAILVLSAVLIIFKEKWTLKTLGIRKDNLKETTIPYIAFTGTGVFVLMMIAMILGKEKTTLDLSFLFWWSIPISVVQEFLYRSFLIQKLQQIYKSVTTIIIVNAIIFAFMHVLFQQPLVVLPLTFFGGIGFAWMYIKYPNLILISLSHAILNFVAIWYGFF